MKQIRLEIPLSLGEEYLPNKVWLKVNGDGTQAFEDKEKIKLITEKSIQMVVYVSVPEGLKSIEVVEPGGINPVRDIELEWKILEMENPEWRMPGLKKVTVLFDDCSHEVPVINEKPDIREWEYYNSSQGEGAWMFLKRWALVVYEFEKDTIGVFYFHSNLIRRN